MPRTFNHVKTGLHNRLLILNQIRLEPGTTRAKLARSCGLTAATVSKVVEKLLQMGYVQPYAESMDPGEGKHSDEEPTRLGRPSLPLQINADRLYTVGLSCDLSGLQACLVNLEGEVVAFQHRELCSAETESPDSYIAALGQLYYALLKETALDPLAVGLAAMGPLDAEFGRIYQHSKIEAWHKFDFIAALQDEVGLPVLLEKNSTAAALYEIWSGRARKLDSILYIYLGHGVGGALILHNEIFRGTFANAGEIGHVNVVPDGRPCLCGHRGCLEPYLSLDSLALEGIDPVCDADLLEQLFAKKDPKFMAWLEQGAALLCRAVGSTVNLLDLSGIMLSGLLPPAVLEFLRSFLEEHMGSHVMKGKAGKLEYLLSRQEHQPSLGAALLPICESFSTGLAKVDAHENLFAD